MINKVILVGNVGKDPETQLVGEAKVSKITLATSESYKNKQGERVTNTEWHNLTFWRGLADVVERYVKKGMMLYVEGKISNRSYEKDGQTRYFTEIVCSEMKMIGKKQEGEQNQSQAPAHTQQGSAPFDDAGQEDDIPF